MPFQTCKLLLKALFYTITLHSDCVCQNVHSCIWLLQERILYTLTWNRNRWLCHCYCHDLLFEYAQKRSK